jgi:hypothetical protein
MFNSGILELAIGLIFVYLILGLMCTSANEWIAGALRWRSKTLETGIRLLLAGGFRRLRPADLKDLAGLAKRLVKGEAPLEKYLQGRLTAETREKLIAFDGSAPPPSELVQALVSELNGVIEGVCIYDDQRFQSVRLTTETKALARGTPRGEECECANRALLQEAFPDLIGGPADQFYRHPLIKSLAPSGKRPSYVPSRTFALAVIDILTSEHPEAANSAAGLQKQIDKLPDGDLKRSINALLHETGDDIVEARRAVERWFDDAMDRVSGWYKRKTHWMIVALAIFVTVLTNADTLRIANTLWREPTVRAQIVAQAEARARQGLPERGAETANRAPVQGLMGWGDELNGLGAAWAKKDVFGWFGALWALVVAHLIGWLLTSVATSLGAPFWFDILNKVINLRSSGRTPEEREQRAAAPAAR